jgi:hypothetical protein
MAFVTFRVKWKLEQLHILRALPLNGWAIALLTSDVHAEQALDYLNGSIWRTLNRSKAEFDFMLLLKGGLATMIPKNDRLMVETDQNSYAARTIVATIAAI